MMTRDAAKNREQMQILSLDDPVPKTHLVRKLENALDWCFIYDLVEEKYSGETGRPTRRFKDSDLLEQIFKHILSECFEAGLVDSSVVFVDSTHVKARANSKKYHDEIAEEQTLWYEKELLEEINRDREAHDLKPLKDKEDDEPPKGGLNSEEAA